MPKAEKDTFKAWKNEMPGADHGLIVTGKVECPTTGWTVKLAEAIPQGTIKEVLILDVDAQAPSGNAGQMVTHVPVRFEKSGATNYQQVTIRGAGPEFTIPVGTAS